MSHIRGQYDLAMAAVHGQTPGAVPAPAPAVPSSYGHSSAAATPAAVAIAVPVPVAGAAGFGAPVRPVSNLGPVMPPSAARYAEFEGWAIAVRSAG